MIKKTESSSSSNSSNSVGVEVAEDVLKRTFSIKISDTYSFFVAAVYGLYGVLLGLLVLVRSRCIKNKHDEATHFDCDGTRGVQLAYTITNKIPIVDAFLRHRFQ